MPLSFIEMQRTFRAAGLVSASTPINSDQLQEILRESAASLGGIREAAYRSFGDLLRNFDPKRWEVAGVSNAATPGEFRVDVTVYDQEVGGIALDMSVETFGVTYDSFRGRLDYGTRDAKLS